ncbi:hypothetical protein cyc_07210 [Cyclospora cayetanensis]|uniref:Uncharacterized protein n=1 Tax=Cyclospora cayetanensis TaxID=88456 RepID=A0A1D3D1M5_9EIME|nr:hypothetical protein cyc_07210 [Cyclospora cayetanensis]
MAAVAAALLQPLQQQVVDALLKSLKDRIEGLLDRLHLERVEFNAAHLTDEFRRHQASHLSEVPALRAYILRDSCGMQIPLEVSGGGIAVVDARLYLTHARLDIIAERCELHLIPKAFAAESEETIAQVTERQLQEVDAHIRQFFVLQKQQELKLRLQRLERLLNKHQRDAAVKKELELEFKEVLQQQQVASAGAETPTHSMLEWLLRYLPNVNLRLEDVKIRLEDAGGLFGPPATLELSFKRIICKPAASKVPWGFEWGDSTAGRSSSGDPSGAAACVVLGPEHALPEVRGSLAVDVLVRQPKLSISKKSSRDEPELWTDVLETSELQLHLLIARETDATATSSANNNNNSNAAASEQRDPLRCRVSVHLLAGERVMLSFDSFSLFYAVCAANKLDHLHILKLLSAYRPPGRPTKCPKAWWLLSKMYTRLLRRERKGSDDFFTQTEERIMHMKRLASWGGGVA